MEGFFYALHCSFRPENYIQYIFKTRDKYHEDSLKK